MTINSRSYNPVIVFIFFLMVAGLSVSVAQTNSSLPVYYFGVPPYQKGQTVDEIRSLYKPMLIWLGEQVGCKFNFAGANTYEEMIAKIVSGRVQLAGLGGNEYITAKERNPNLKLLFTELKWDENKTKLIDSYTGYILTLKSRVNINTLEDLKGKRFSFVNRHSTSGFQYPNALMRQKGIIPEKFFSRVFFLGSHPRVTDAIVSGSIDAGATWDYNWGRAIKKHGDVFKAIFTTPPIPNLTIVAHPSLPGNIVKKIEKVLPKIDASLLKGLPTAGFVKRPDSFYDSVRILKKYSESH